MRYADNVLSERFRVSGHMLENMNTQQKCCRLDIDVDLITKATELLQTEEDHIVDQARIFALLGNEVRLKIMTLFLHYERMCVCDLSEGICPPL